MKKPQPRRYELKKRAEALEETRRRITEVTIDLHRTVGPAATRITDIAERADVQRATVYNHFPDEASLLASCSAHWRAHHPAPDPVPWREIEDPSERLRVGLGELYAWYRETERMTANVLRDAELIPALKQLIDNGLSRYLDDVTTVLTEQPRLRGRRAARVQAAARTAVDFHTCKSLGVLGDRDAAEIAARMIEAATL